MDQQAATHRTQQALLAALETIMAVVEALVVGQAALFAIKQDAKLLSQAVVAVVVAVVDITGFIPTRVWP